MVHHVWGDGFDFNGLYIAGRWIETFYRRLTKNHIQWKEKYGTLRYEYEWAWITEKDQAVVFFEILKRACLKFPKFAGELISDVIPSCTHIYYKGYFEGVLWGSSKSRWSSSKTFKPWRGEFND
jgi:hypothetical protein